MADAHQKGSQVMMAGKDPYGWTLHKTSNYFLTAFVFDETSGRYRCSVLNLDHCLSRDHSGGDHSYYAAARAPKNFTNPRLEHTEVSRWKLSDAVNEREGMIIVALEQGIIHNRNEIYVPIFPNKVADSYIKLKDHVRITKTGRWERMHP